MENFVFSNPTTIIFGKGTAELAGREAKRYGNRILLVYGQKHVRKSGILDRITGSLAEAGVSFFELSGVKSNPALDPIYKGIEMCRAYDIDFILAVGGGSVIDTAKAIGVGACHPEDIWMFFEGQVRPKKTLPVGVVLTVPGSGSESSSSCVITNDDKLIKRSINTDMIRPVFAIMDPELTYSLAPFYTACGVADAMSHAMERYFTATKHVDCTDRLCEALITSLIHNGPIAIENPDDYDARAEIMLASKFAHDNTVGVGRIGDFGTHKFGHQLSVMYGLTHGASITAIFPSWMRYVYKRDLPRFDQYAVRVWGVEYMPEDPEGVALEGIRRTVDFYRRLGLPANLREAGIPNDKFEEMVDRIFAVTGGAVGGYMRLDRLDCLNVLELAYAGED